MTAQDTLLAYPQVCGLLGVNPSRLSYAMHSAGFKALSLPFTYTAFDTRNTEAGLAAMRELGFRGFSLTIPHKEQALSLVDELSDEARDIRAINTVVNTGTVLQGFNTDWYGIVESLGEAGFAAEGKKALVFGAGGASRAALYALKQLQFAAVLLTNRTKQRGRELAEAFDVEFLELEKVNNRVIEGVDLFINATPIGLPMAGKEQDYPFDLSIFSQGHTVFDMVTRDTELIQTSRENGARTISGIRMLLYQALPQFELFTEQPAPKEVMEEALITELENSP